MNRKLTISLLLTVVALIGVPRALANSVGGPNGVNIPTTLPTRPPARSNTHPTPTPTATPAPANIVGQGGGMGGGVATPSIVPPISSPTNSVTAAFQAGQRAAQSARQGVQARQQTLAFCSNPANRNEINANPLLIQLCRNIETAGLIPLRIGG